MTVVKGAGVGSENGVRMHLGQQARPIAVKRGKLSVLMVLDAASLGSFESNAHSTPVNSGATGAILRGAGAARPRFASIAQSLCQR